MIQTFPLAREVVLVGGGHAHVLLLRRWGMNPVPGARLTVINPGPTAPYTGMLPGFVAGHYEREALEIDLVRLARFADARLILGHARGIDRTKRRILIEGRPGVAYDIASIDVGITSEMPDLPGFAEHGIAAKPLGAFASGWSAFLANALPGPVAVIGGGIGGIELALAMSHALRRRGHEPRVTLIEAQTIAAALDEGTRDRLRRNLAAGGVAVIEKAGVARISGAAVHLADGRDVPSAFTVGAAGARPHGWLRDTGLALSEGFIEVDETLRSVSDPAIYAVGDCAHLRHDPRPKAGVFAVRAAPILTANIRADLTGGRRRAFRPQTHYLKLIALGPKRALAHKWNRAVEGRWAWVWKDHIDRRFMERLNDPPFMRPPPPPRNAAIGVAEALGPKPLCGGCGSKVGAGVLDEALARIAAPDRPDILTAPGDDAAVIDFGAVRQVITTDHLRAFWNDPYLMTRIAALHALTDVWAMGARPQALLASITLPRMAPPMQSSWLEECLAAAQGVAEETGAALVGGHTTMGAELSIGFTATGTLDRPALRLSGARAGDALVLTRPIGSGTVLAAEMAGEARGDDVAEMLSIMARPQREAAERLASLATAMTDVTGFGLAGHAARMADASGLSAEIDLDAVPLYRGAEALAAAGIASTIAPANRAAVGCPLPETPRGALMADPQTAGGLLAALPAEAVDDILATVDGATVIGRMRPPGDCPLTIR